jgi:eukaryotic-like serine/threonine-protein kinase
MMGTALAAVALIATTVTIAAWPRDTPAGSDQTGTALPSAGSPPPAAPSGAPATDINASQLRGILLTDAEIGAAAHGDPMVLEGDGSAALDDSATVNNPQCLGAWAPAQNVVYANGSDSGVAVQQLRAMNQTWHDGITQAVIAFGSQDKAGISWVTQRGQWALCGGKTIAVTAPGQPAQSWDFAQPVTTSGVLTIAATVHGGSASCQHGILVRGNVVIDIRQCRPDGTPNVAALITTTAAKVPQQ